MPGAAIVLLVVLAVTGLALSLRSSPRRANLVVWTFAAEHVQMLMSPGSADGRSVIEHFQKRTGRSVSIELMPPRSLDLRLMSMLQSEQAPHSDALPDVVQLESLSAAKFLDGAADEIALLPLEGRMARDGLFEHVLPSRLVAWSRHGHVYGVPFDVHPVTLAYRRDLFEAAGLDPAACTTWEELANVLERYCDYWSEHGEPGRRALELARTRSDHLTLMLQQRGIDLVDERGTPSLADPRIAPLIGFCADLLAGERPVAMPTSEGHGRYASELARGEVAMIWTPDWRIAQLEAAAPELAGKLAMMPLPRFEASDARTAVWGGAMLAIPRDAPDSEASWELLKHLAFSDESLAARSATYVLPAYLDALDDPANDTPIAFWGGQPIRRLYAQLAREAPAQRLTPLDIAVSAHLASILSRACDGREQGMTGMALQGELARWLAEAQHDLERRADFMGD